MRLSISCDACRYVYGGWDSYFVLILTLLSDAPRSNAFIAAVHHASDATKARMKDVLSQILGLQTPINVKMLPDLVHGNEN